MKEKWTKETGPMTYLDIFSSHFENLLNIIRKPWIGKENDPEVHDVFALEAVSRCNIRIQNGKKLFAWTCSIQSCYHYVLFIGQRLLSLVLCPSPFPHPQLPRPLQPF